MSTKKGLTRIEFDDVRDVKGLLRKHGVKAAQIAAADPSGRTEDYLRRWLSSEEMDRPDFSDLPWMARGLGEPFANALMEWLYPEIYSLVARTKAEISKADVAKETGEAVGAHGKAVMLRLVASADGVIDSAEEAAMKEADKVADRQEAESRAAAMALTMGNRRANVAAGGR